MWNRQLFTFGGCKKKKQNLFKGNWIASNYMWLTQFNNKKKGTIQINCNCQLCLKQLFFKCEYSKHIQQVSKQDKCNKELKLMLI